MNEIHNYNHKVGVLGARCASGTFSGCQFISLSMSGSTGAMLYAAGPYAVITDSGTSDGNTLIFRTDLIDNAATGLTGTNWSLLMPMNQDVRTTATPTFAGITVPNGGMIGQSSGPQILFDDTNNWLYISNCSVSIGTGSRVAGFKTMIVGGGLGVFGSDSGSGLTIRPGANGETVNVSTDYLGTTEPNLHLSSYSERAGAGGITIIPGGNVGINDVAPAEKLDVNGNANVTGVYKVDDVQVVGAQAASQADLKADYTTLDLDTEAEIIAAINATNAGFNTLLAKLRTHGLIDT
jgi:hypothetical protein